VAASCVTAVVTGTVTAETEPLSGDVAAFAADATWATVDETGAVTRAIVPVAADVAALPVETTWLPAEDTKPVAEEAELASAEVADLPVEVTWLAVDCTVPAVVETVPAVLETVPAVLAAPAAPAACVAADVVADTADVAEEPGAASVDAAGLAVGALDVDPESATVETAVWPVEAAGPTAEDTSAVTVEVLVAVPPVASLSAVVAAGLVDADADRAVRREKTMATPIAAMAMPAAHTQSRRTLVTSPLVTTVTLIGPR
jgi:hypothetical protein